MKKIEAIIRKTKFEEVIEAKISSTPGQSTREVLLFGGRGASHFQ